MFILFRLAENEIAKQALGSLEPGNKADKSRVVPGFLFTSSPRLPRFPLNISTVIPLLFMLHGNSPLDRSSALNVSLRVGEVFHGCIRG